jgi:hypothetical protein
MEFKLHRLSDYSDAALLEELRRVAEAVPAGPITRAIFSAHSAASASTVMKRFGGWKEALNAAGLSARYGGHLVTERMRQQPGKTVTQEQAIKELRRISAKLGRQDLTVDDFNAHASFSVAAVRRHFRPWRRALEAAGLIPGQHSRRYSDEECYENLLRVWMHLGRPPQYLEMGSPPSQVGGKAYVRRWKTWIKALEAFADRVNQDDTTPVATLDGGANVVSETPNSPPNEDEGRIRLGLRYRAIVRDNFRCVLCGNSPAIDPTCRLHVDHIHPHSKGGPTAIENLRTLCNSCNIGKGDLTIERGPPTHE